MVGSFTKIEYHPDRPVVRITRVDDRINDESVKSVLISPDPPAESLPNALAALEPWVVEVTRVTDAWFDGPARIVSVVIGAGESAPVTVIAHRWIAGHNRPAVLATPAVAQYGGDELVVPQWVREAVKALEVAAEAFWRGQRAQLSLADDASGGAQGELGMMHSPVVPS